MPGKYDKRLEAETGVDRVAFAYEQAWLQGQRPAIDDFLGHEAAVDQDALVRELIATDVELSGGTRCRSDYADLCRRFPQIEPFLCEVLESAAADSDSTGRSDTHHGFADALSADSPQRFGPFEILEEVGRGGMGVIYRARQTEPARIVALKTIRAAQLASPEELQRFRFEADAVARLDHANIVPVFDYGEHDSTQYLVMPFISGRTLSEEIRDTLFAPMQAARFMGTVSEAVQHAHDRGVIHRDLKPGNVLIDPAGVPRITDFGLARPPGTDHELTVDGQIIGTPSFMAPEQAAAEQGGAAVAADVYSLGAILYFVLTGRPPFQGATPLETVQQVLEHDVVPPSALVATIPRDLETVCLKCLDKDPSRRYVSASELADDLYRFAEHRPIRARPVGRLARVLRWCRRRPAVAAAIVLTCAFVAASFAAVVAHYRLRVAEQDRAYAKREQIRARDSALFADSVVASQTSREIQTYLRQRRVMKARDGLDRYPQAFRGAYYHYLHDRMADQRVHETATWLPGEWPVCAVAVNPQHTRIIAADHAGTLAILDCATDEIQIIERGLRSAETARTIPRHARAEVGRSDEAVVLAGLAWPEPDSIYAVTHEGTLFHVDPTDTEPRLRAVGTLEESVNCLATASSALKIGLGTDRGFVEYSPQTQEFVRVATGSAAVTAVAFAAALDCWLIGDAAGELMVVDRDYSVTPTGRNLGACIWDIAVDSRDPGRIAAAVAGGGPVVLFNQGAGDWSHSFRLAYADGAGSSTKSVAFLNRDMLVSSGTGHAMTVWDLPARSMWDDTADIHADPRMTPERIAALPLPLQRLDAGVVPLGDERVVTAGVSGLVRQWDVDAGPTSASIFTRSPEPFGSNADVVFDESAHLLWHLDESGVLTLIDPDTLRALDSVEAHRPASIPDRPLLRRADLRPLASGGIVTTARDRRVRFWSSRNSRIVAEPRSGFESSAPLLSVDVCEPRGLVAGVDAQAHVVVWELGSGRRLHDEVVETASELCPHVGIVRFNRDGARLVVSGDGQTIKAYRTDRMSVEPVAVYSAGEGAVEACWSREQDGLLIVSDTRPERVAVEFDDVLVHLRESGNFGHLRSRNRGVRATDIDTLADGTGFATLHENGIVTFESGEHYFEIGEIVAPVDKYCALAVNRQCDRLVLATRDGDLRSLQIGSVRQPVGTRHSAVVPQRITNAAAPAGTRMALTPILRYDTHARPAFLYGTTTTEYRRDCRLHVAHAQEQGWVTEEIAMDPSAPAGLVDFYVPALRFTAGQTLVAFRQRRLDVDQYSGDLMLARKTPGADWQYEPVFATANVGQYPAIHLSSDGSVHSILHFATGGLWLLASQAGSDGPNGWAVPHQVPNRGTARSIQVGERTWFVSRSHRFNSDGARQRLGVWDGERLQFLRLPQGFDRLDSCGTLESEPVYVLSPIDDRRHPAVYSRGSGGWRLLREHVPRGMTRILSDGRIVTLALRDSGQELQAVIDGHTHIVPLKGLPSGRTTMISGGNPKGGLDVVLCTARPRHGGKQASPALWFLHLAL